MDDLKRDLTVVRDALSELEKKHTKLRDDFELATERIDELETALLGKKIPDTSS